MAKDNEHPENPAQVPPTPEEKPIKRYRLRTVIITGAAALIIGAGGTVGAGALYLHQQNAQADADVTYVPNSFKDLLKVYSDVKNNYYIKTSDTKLVTGAINGMLKTLNDPFSQYLQGSDAKELNTTISGSFEGIGAEISQADGHIQIVSPIKGSPADKAGLKAKDIITAIDGKSTQGWSTTKASSTIRGKKGTSVTLAIKRGSDTFNITIKRGVVPLTTVTGELSDQNKKVGVISITQFADNTNKELKKSITSLRKQGAKSFVIDLRQNPGGLLPQALETASMFLKDGQRIMQVQQRDSKPEIFTAGKEYDDGFKVTEPVTVLIDSGSASASEIFSGALQESRRTKLIGEKSFGKGVVQTVSQLSGDSEVKITTAKWLTPSGGWIQKKGLTPDIKVSYPAYASWPLLNTKKVNKPGTVATDIATAQKILNLSGAKLTQTAGYFDSATETALKAFQTQQKITVSGELDSATKTALNNYVYAQATKSDPMLTKAVETVAAEK